MSRERWSDVDRYVDELLVGEDAALRAARDSAAAAGLPPHDVSPSQGKLLHLLARLSGARAILELGTLGGYSTIWLARALPDGGRLITLEAEAAYADVARTNLARAGLADVVEVRVGDARETLPELVAGGRAFDLIFIDADKRGNPEYFAWALDLSHEGTLIVADNVVREGALLAENGDASGEGVRTFLELAAAEPRVTGTVIQTVGSKGWDGFALVLVTSER